MDIDLRRLRFFVEVVRHGGFSQAAKVVFASQPTVSKAVKLLEHELGMPLLERNGRRSVLTAAGTMVYDRAVRLLADGDDLVAQLEELQGVTSGTLRIGFPKFGSSALFAAAFAAFRRDYPGVHLELQVHAPRQLEAMLRAGELDLAAIVEPVPPDFDRQVVHSDRLVVLLPRDHPLAGRPKVKVDRLLDSPLILLEEGLALNDVILDACRSKGVIPQIAVRTGQLDFMFELVATGVGIAFLPRAIGELRPHPRVRTPLLEPACDWRIAFAWRKGGSPSHAQRAWLACVRNEQTQH